MALYSFQAVLGGKTQELSIEADSQREAQQKLRSRGATPVRYLGEGESLLSGGAGGGGAHALFHASHIDVLDFTTQLSPLLSSAIPLERALGILAESAVAEEQKQLILTLRQGLHEGKKFSDLIRSYGALFPGYYANLIETGEETGCLPEVVVELEKVMTESRELKEFLKSSSIYPCFVVGLTILIMGLLFTVFVPRFAQMFEDMGREQPASMKFLMFLSHGVLYGLLIGAAAGIGGFFAAKAYFGVARLRRARAALILKLPMFGALSVELEMSKFIRTLAILLSNHVDIIRSVRIAVKVIQNPLVRESFLNLEGRLKGGEKLSAAIADNAYIPIGLAAKVRVGEESGTVGNMLARTAHFQEEGSRRKIKRMLSVFEPLIIVFLALIVLVVVVAIFVAIMDLNSVEM